jgi:hypothetical protein
MFDACITEPMPVIGPCEEIFTECLTAELPPDECGIMFEECMTPIVDVIDPCQGILDWCVIEEGGDPEACMAEYEACLGGPDFPH